MSGIGAARWALLLDVLPPPRVTEIDASSASLPVASCDLALVGGRSADLDAVLGAAGRALVAGGGLVLTRPGSRDAVERAGFTDVRVFATLRDPVHPKYLVPLDHRGAAEYFFRSVAPRRPDALDRGLVRIAAGLTRLGLLGRIAPGRQLVATKPPRTGDGFLVEEWLRAEAASIVGAQRARSVHFVMVAGWKQDGTTLTALGFEAGARAPAFVAKVATGSSTNETPILRRNLQILSAAFEESATPPVPRLLHAAQRPGATATFESVVAGQPLRVPVGTRGLRALALRMSEWLLDFHRRTGPGTVTLDAATAERLLIRPFRAYRARFRPGAEEAAYLESASLRARQLADRPLPLVLAHGDLCPPNLVEQGGNLGVLDWELPLQPSLPAHDLIHFLACLGVRGYEGYEEVFFSRGRRARIAREVLLAYATALGIEHENLETLFTLFWLDYAVEKAELGETSRVPEGEPWGLARLERGTCLNLERLACAGNEFILRVP